MYKKVALIFIFGVAVASFAGSVQAMYQGSTDYQRKKAQKDKAKDALEIIARGYVHDDDSNYKIVALDPEWKKVLDEHAKKRLEEWKILKWLRNEAYSGRLNGELLSLYNKAYRGGKDGKSLSSYKEAKKERMDAWIEHLAKAAQVAKAAQEAEQARVRAEQEAREALIIAINAHVQAFIAEQARIKAEQEAEEALIKIEQEAEDALIKARQARIKAEQEAEDARIKAEQALKTSSSK